MNKSVIYILNAVSAMVLNYNLSISIHKILIYILCFSSAIALNDILSMNCILKVDLNFIFSFPFHTNFITLFINNNKVAAASNSSYLNGHAMSGWCLNVEIAGVSLTTYWWQSASLGT